jgi:predicted nucleic acid-binding protein
VAKRFYLDASALAKRYVVEQGTFVVNHLFRCVARDAMMCLTLGTLEVLSIFVRKKNASTIPHAAFNQAMTDFRSEVIDAANFTKIPAPDSLVNAAAPLVAKPSLNATDAVILRSVLDLVATLRATGDALVLVTSDQRLLRAAQEEGVLTSIPQRRQQATWTLYSRPDICVAGGASADAWR